MKKITIHIGLHKTGSTFLQKEIFSKYQNLTYLSRPFTQYNRIFNLIQYQDESLYTENEIIDLLNQFLKEKILISDENLSGKIMGYSYINRSIIAHRLAKLTRKFDVDIIIFLRGQKTMMASVYNQWVKSHLHGDRPIDQFFWYPKQNFDLETFEKYGNGDESMSLDYLYYNTNKYYVHIDSFKYYEFIELYKSLFSNVHVLLFEDLKEKPEETLYRLDQIIGETRQENSNKESEKPNASISISNLYEKTILNRHIATTKAIPYTHRLLKFLISTQNAKKRNFEKDYLGFLEKSSHYYAKNNRLLADKYPEIGIQNHESDYLIQ